MSARKGRLLPAAALAAACLPAALGLSCDDDVLPPTPGEVYAVLSASQSGARALLVTLVGRNSGAGVILSTPYRVFSTDLGGDTTRIAVVAPEGASLAAGPLFAVNVADVNAAGSYRITVDEVAGADYSLLSTALFTVSLTRP
jgi:hypothetical protein